MSRGKPLLAKVCREFARGESTGGRASGRPAATCMHPLGATRQLRAGTILALERVLLVAAGAVEAGDGDVVEAEVDAEDRAVVDDVVHEEAADDGAARHGEDYAFAAAQCPHIVERFIF